MKEWLIDFEKALIKKLPKNEVNEVVSYALLRKSGS